MAVLGVSHLGLCVSDLERSLRFYRDALGFREVSRLELSGEPASTLLGLSPLALRAVVLARDGLQLELLVFPEPGHRGDGVPRAMNALGFTHLSLRVDDLGATLRALERAGAHTLEATRIDVPGAAAAVFVTDPDGTRIELVETRDAPAPGATPRGR